MKESSIIKLAVRATNRNKDKKSVTIQDSADFGFCRYVKTHGGIYMVSEEFKGGKLIAEQVPFVSY